MATRATRIARMAAITGVRRPRPAGAGAGWVSCIRVPPRDVSNQSVRSWAERLKAAQSTLLRPSVPPFLLPRSDGKGVPTLKALFRNPSSSGETVSDGGTDPRGGHVKQLLAWERGRRVLPRRGLGRTSPSDAFKNQGRQEGGPNHYGHQYAHGAW